MSNQTMPLTCADCDTPLVEDGQNCPDCTSGPMTPIETAKALTFAKLRIAKLEAQIDRVRWEAQMAKNAFSDLSETDAADMAKHCFRAILECVGEK